MLSSEILESRNSFLFITLQYPTSFLTSVSLHSGIFLLSFQVRFLLRCGREDEAQEKEVPRYGDGLISSLFGLTIRYDVLLYTKLAHFRSQCST